MCYVIWKDIRLRAGYALAIFGFNNTAQQLAIREAGGLPLECLEEFLQSGNEFQRATAAFQVIRVSMLSACFINSWRLSMIYLCVVILEKSDLLTCVC